MDEVLPPKDDYSYHVSPELKSFFFKRAEKFKAEINDPTFFDMIEKMKKLYSDK